MDNRFVFDTGRVFDFVRSQMPFNAVEGMVGIGFERDGELIAGVMYEGYNGRNIWLHVAALTDKRWLTRSYMKVCFAYPFVQLGVNRISGYVNESNTLARRFDEHLGFKEEARLRGAAADGGDVIIYAMHKEECRYV